MSASQPAGPVTLERHGDIAHVVVDGAIAPDALAADLRADVLCPQAMADLYLFLHRQPASAWTQELDLRPWVERF